MDSDIEQILTAANTAPSGENCQPWHFVVHPGNVIELRLLPERDQSYYSWGQRASYVALGAALENMVIAATSRGYRTDIAYNFTGNHIATVTLEKDSSINADPLHEAIKSRITNRNPYATEPLKPEEKQSLVESVAHEEGKLVLIESRESIESLAKVGGLNEEIMLGNHALHDFFFNHVSWTKEEDAKKKVGFYIETLELPPPAKAMFKLFRRWGTMRFFNAFGFNKIVGGQNATTYASASAVGVFAIKGSDPADFLKAGRAIERVWLTATKLGLAMQPMTGILYFHLKIAHGEGSAFNKEEQEKIEKGYTEVVSLAGAEGMSIVFMFRIGHGKPASAHAVRFPLEEAVSIVS